MENASIAVLWMKAWTLQGQACKRLRSSDKDTCTGSQGTKTDDRFESQTCLWLCIVSRSWEIFTSLTNLFNNKYKKHQTKTCFLPAMFRTKIITQVLLRVHVCLFLTYLHSLLGIMAVGIQVLHYHHPLDCLFPPCIQAPPCEKA